MKKVNSEDLDNVLPNQLYRLGRLLRHYLQQKLNLHEPELTPEQYFIIYRLYQKNGLTQRELADKVLHDHPNITRLIDKLVKKGFVQREDDTKDRRNYIIKLSAKGKDVFKQAIPLITEEHNKLLKGISDEEIKYVRNIIRKIEVNIIP